MASQYSNLCNVDFQRDELLMFFGHFSFISYELHGLALLSIYKMRRCVFFILI